MNTRKTKIIVSIILVYLCNSAIAQSGPSYLKGSLCKKEEDIIISFKTAQKKKLASICAGPGNSYLVYRYGNLDQVELNYPTLLNSKSWKNFFYSSYSRGLGESNDPRGNYEISFINSGTEYSVYQDWSTENSYEIGIIVINKGRNYKILGIPESQTGSLSRLEAFKDFLSNQE